MTHKEIAKLFVDAEIRLHGRCKTKSMIQLSRWISGDPIIGDYGYFTTEELIQLKRSALLIECYNVMVQELTPGSSNG